MICESPRTHPIGCIVLAAVLILVCPLGCQTQVAPPDNTANVPDGTTNPPGGTGNETISFSTQIQPILSANCSVCHRPGGIAFLAGIALQLTEDVSYDFLVNQTSVQDASLTLVVPGDSASSLLFSKVSSDAPPVGERMPLTFPILADSDIALIQDWIDEGALDN